MFIINNLTESQLQDYNNVINALRAEQRWNIEKVIEKLKAIDGDLISKAMIISYLENI